MPNNQSLLALAGSLTLLSSLPSVGAAESVSNVKIEIPYKKFVLTNGLTLIVHEDHKAPIVAVNVWYHVGSKNEKPGKTGFAHLFEHLMFTAVRISEAATIKASSGHGAHRRDGPQRHDQRTTGPTTSRTSPTNALDVRCGWNPTGWGTCWARSTRPSSTAARRRPERKAPGRERALRRHRRTDHQGHGAARASVFLDGDRLDGRPQRGFAGGRARPGSRPTTGPPTPCVVLAGDIDADTALKKVEKYFGDIPARAAGGHGMRNGSRRSTGKQRQRVSRTASLRPESTRCGICRLTARPRRMYLDFVADASWRLARRRGFTSGWSMTTRSQRMFQLTSMTARSAASS